MLKVNSTSGLRAFTVPHSMTYGQLQTTLRELGCGTSSGVTYNDQACSLALSSQMSLKPRAQNGTEDIHKKRQTSATQGLTFCFSGSHPAFLDGLGTEQSWESSETSRSVLHKSMTYVFTWYRCRLQTLEMQLPNKHFRLLYYVGWLNISRIFWWHLQQFLARPYVGVVASATL